ncbi:hypothetical protein [Methylocystis bryophila]|uniref:Sulfatase N-terminal domain-containing protein n=1 Tax=Methylocystis bryophila TaxID=655015 RepID=A0A1W6MUE8_9HYPH|nr:hypothetical protein [Methylocystis bryophila]ARN81109.1 hypothetical protein B1812_08490 [Methylocystis bryophila]
MIGFLLGAASPLATCKDLMSVHRDSVLFVTLDSCRFDTFLAASAPNMKAIAPLHKASAPSHFTFGSHAAMFVGFTPSIGGCGEPFLDNKFAKIFKLAGGGYSGNKPEFDLTGTNVIAGFRRLGYTTIGSGAVGWFDPQTETGRNLTCDFEHYFYVGTDGAKQIAWMRQRIEAANDKPVFCFLNLGETHVPYWHKGASWSRNDNPCQPYGKTNRADDCRLRQRLCCEYIDREIKDLLEPFFGATILICADHGDCWGEDNLWEHGVSHSMTLTVPLIVRIRGKPIAKTGN